MASSAELQVEPVSHYSLQRCLLCEGGGKILYPFPGNRSDQPLGGVKIKGTTCVECGGSGNKNLPL